MARVIANSLRKTSASKPAQSARFIEAACEAGANEDEAVFDEIPYQAPKRIVGRFRPCPGLSFTGLLHSLVPPTRGEAPPERRLRSRLMTERVG